MFLLHKPTNTLFPVAFFAQEPTYNGKTMETYVIGTNDGVILRDAYVSLYAESTGDSGDRLGFHLYSNTVKYIDPSLSIVGHWFFAPLTYRYYYAVNRWIEEDGVYPDQFSVIKDIDSNSDALLLTEEV